MGMFIRFLLAFILGANLDVILMCIMRVAAEADDR